MPKIYIVLTQTGTYLSKVIKKVTGNKYNHVSISLKEDLSGMYSFGRRNPYNALVAGFIQESPKFGTFKRFKNTVCQILELEISEESYRIIEDIVKRFYEERDRFKFNMIGIIMASKKINYQKTYRKFYCSQFVRYLLVCAHIIPDDFFGKVVTPQDFALLPNAVSVYEGLLREYSVSTEPSPVLPLSEEEKF